MAKLMLVGEVAQVELTTDPEDGQIIATCVEHGTGDDFAVLGCGWVWTYDTVNDASEYAEDHADTGRE